MGFGPCVSFCVNCIYVWCARVLVTLTQSCWGAATPFVGSGNEFEKLQISVYFAFSLSSLPHWLHRPVSLCFSLWPEVSVCWESQKEGEGRQRVGGERCFHGYQPAKVGRSSEWEWGNWDKFLNWNVSIIYYYYQSGSGVAVLHVYTHWTGRFHITPLLNWRPGLKLHGAANTPRWFVWFFTWRQIRYLS